MPMGTYQGIQATAREAMIQDGKRYPQYHCSPQVTSSTKAVLIHNSFEKAMTAVAIRV
jgi:hypothetical protein